jgi:hypothetical protein
MYNPYINAVKSIEQDPDACQGLAMLILSLWHTDGCFSLVECLQLDPIRRQAALDILSHFIEHGKDQQLLEAGNCVFRMCPDLWNLARVASIAKQKLKGQWGDEQMARYRQEHPGESEDE